MRTSHKLTRLFLALTALMALATASFAQAPTVTAQVNSGVINQIEVSDQKPGSVLVFPYYTSSLNNKWDTRVTISNIATANLAVGQNFFTNSIVVHVFFVRGSDCQQSDMFICLTKGASMSFSMMTQDPDTTGYVVAVAVDYLGLPVSWNALIGNAFVNRGTTVGNYGAESFASTAPLGWRTTTASASATTAQLVFNGAFGVGGGVGLLPTVPNQIQANDPPPTTAYGYDQVPNQFAVEIQSNADAPGQTVWHAGLEGNLNTSSITNPTQAGTGLVWRSDEKQGSFVRWLSSGCQTSGTIGANSPRIPGTLDVFIKKGDYGVLRYDTSGPSVGILVTPLQFAASPATGVVTQTYGGIRTLHKTKVQADTRLTIPVYMPVC